MNEEILQQAALQAARAIENAGAVLIGAGAGMGVDSGLPDFRGNEGFWNAYPPFKAMGLSFVDLANPTWFETDPHLAWGFYGHRLNLYRATTPHQGFHILQQLCAGKRVFVFTSNVDGHFQKSGFNSLSVEECHGSIHHLQCTNSQCIAGNRFIWSAEKTQVEIDPETYRAVDPLPTCPKCGALARPNILFFRDRGWIEDRSEEQQRRYFNWQAELEGQVAVIEFGAGTAIPSVRVECEHIAKQFGGTLIRVNPREAIGPAGTISMSTGALEGLTLISNFVSA